MSPESRAALSLLAHSYYQQDEYEAAARTYETLAKKFPAIPEYKLYWSQSMFKVRCTYVAFQFVLTSLTTSQPQ